MSKTQGHSIHPLDTKKNNFQNPRCITSYRQFQSPAINLCIQTDSSKWFQFKFTNNTYKSDSVALRLSTSLRMQLMQHLTSRVVLTTTPPKPQLSVLLPILGGPLCLQEAAFNPSTV
ncbi:hypothetical protein GOP47_0005598 [Adiantum capillus-veneris]|uniref:Uncharacterized protein n=1 Tax=Adiantum capillus-veneris TaxID=13818 RepID=A0A9D4V5U9_ADICA|nr:hypothetical protein GOP47_0005598 [Adiantum capillus-veneris]